MNLFLIDADVKASCKAFAWLDQLRARKQLLEACQLIASVDHLLWGHTELAKKDGDPYGRGHVHHPITKHMLVSTVNYKLAVELALGLANVFPSHACAASIKNWMRGGYITRFARNMNVIENAKQKTICVCRRGEPAIYVDSLEEYAKIMHAYLIANKWNVKTSV